MARTQASGSKKLGLGMVAASAIALYAAPADACRNLNFEYGTAHLFTTEGRRGDVVDLDNVSSRRSQFYGGPENPVCDYQAKLQTDTPSGYTFNDTSSYHNTCNYYGFVYINWYQWNGNAVQYGSTMSAFWKDDETEGFEKYCLEHMNGYSGS